MADLLTQLDVIAWDVCPEHKEVYFAIYSFPSIRTSRYTRIANHSVLRFDMTYALFDK